MAALGKIRSAGVLLISIIGIGLFAFIAEEAVRSCEASKNERRQQVGEVLGEKINVQDFQKLVDEYTEVIKMQQGAENLQEAQLNQVKDMVWNTYVQTKIVEEEATKLGLTVTDGELQNIFKQGTNPMLMQTPFINQQTGRFDVNQLQKFLAEYNKQKGVNPQMAQQYEPVYKYWRFIEKNIRQQLLAQKYQSLLAHCLLSNPVEAKAAYADETTESKINLAVFPYSSIADDKVQITDADMKAKYEELKDRFEQFVESRSAKYVDVLVEASAADRAALQKQFAQYTTDLAAAVEPIEAVRKMQSLIPCLGLPVTKAAYPMDIATRLDSMAVGQVWGPVENKQDNTLNVIKLVSKQMLPDSIQYRQIQVVAEKPEEAAKRADSIYNAIKGGADFEKLAKQYGQTGEKLWLTSNQYQAAPSLDVDTKSFITSLNNMSAGELKLMNLGQAHVVMQVLDRKAMVAKYVAAVVKKNIEFSKETYSAAYNKFSTFVSANQTLESIEKNAAKSGYRLSDAGDVTTNQHYIGGIRSTREALKWLFDGDTKEGAVSPMYECGDNNHLLVVVLERVHKAGYRTLKDMQVREMVRAEVMKEKKAALLADKAKGVNSVKAAEAKGAKVTTVDQVTFAAPVFVAATGTSEPALSGAVAATAKGAFCKNPVKGNAGLYYFSVTGKSNRQGKYDAKAQEEKTRQRLMQYAGNFMNDLYIKADVVDNRYLFF